MPSPGYDRRMARILSAQHEAQARTERPRRRRHALTTAVIAPLGAVAVFFLLKGVLLAIQGEAGFAQHMAAVDPGARMGGLRLWLAGIDPVTELLAQFLRPMLGAASGPAASG